MPERLHWADIAKAMAVVLVVMYHVVPTGMTMLTPGTNAAEEFYGSISNWLLPVRMPLFFLISGVLSVRALDRPWRQVLRPRVADHLWVFVLWTLLLLWPYASAYAPNATAQMAVRELSWIPTLGGAYWYLPLLALFFVLVKVGRRFGPWLIVGAVALYGMRHHIPAPGFVLGDDAVLTLKRIGTFFVWFLLGALARPMVERWARVPWWVWVPAFAAYWPLAMINVDTAGIDLVPLLSIMGITWALGIASLAARLPVLQRLGRYLAERTLPIYVWHPLLVALLIWLTPGFGERGDAFSIPVVPLLIVGLVAAACVLYDLTRPHLPWLYRAPGGRLP